MKPFNLDRRVAVLSSRPPDLVEVLAEELWKQSQGWELDAFLSEWLATVEAAVEVARLEAERELLSKEAARLRQAEQSEQRRRAQELERQSVLKAAERQLQAEEAQRQADDRERRHAARRRSSELRSQVHWLYNITAVGNVASIAKHGILCHEEAARLSHDDISNRGVQDRRARMVVAGGRSLHQLASLYFNPRNAMLYQLCMEGPPTVVLRVYPDVLDLPGVVVTDGNAASGDSRSWLAYDGLANVPLNAVYAHAWETPEEKRILQAEVLVPQQVPPELIQGFIAPSDHIRTRVQSTVTSWRGSVDPTLFFGLGSKITGAVESPGLIERG